jgi:hypothetical protein
VVCEHPLHSCEEAITSRRVEGDVGADIADRTGDIRMLFTELVVAGYIIGSGKVLLIHHK